MEFVFQNESDVSDFMNENLRESAQNYESVVGYLKTLPEKTWQEILLACERVIRDELQAFIADVLTEEDIA